VLDLWRCEVIYRKRPTGQSRFGVGNIAALEDCRCIRSIGAINSYFAASQNIDIPDDLRSGGEIVGAFVGSILIGNGDIIVLTPTTVAANTGAPDKNCPPLSVMSEYNIFCSCLQLRKNFAADFLCIPTDEKNCPTDSICGAAIASYSGADDNNGSVFVLRGEAHSIFRGNGMTKADVRSSARVQRNEFLCWGRSAVPCFALSRQENFVRRTAVFESGTFLYPTYARGLLFLLRIMKRQHFGDTRLENYGISLPITQ